MVKIQGPSLWDLFRQFARNAYIQMLPNGSLAFLFI